LKADLLNTHKEGPYASYQGEWRTLTILFFNCYIEAAHASSERVLGSCP